MTTNNKIKTLTKTFEIIEVLKSNNGGTISDISSLTGMTPSTVHRHLATLRDHEYVVQQGNTYDLSFRFVDISKTIRNRDVAFELAEETVSELAETTGERAQFFIEEHGKAVYVCLDTGKHGVLTDSHIGKTVPLHATGGGKAILAHLPKDRVNKIIEETGLSELTSNTVTSKKELLEELSTIRNRGYSTNKEEYSKGSYAVGVPVLNEKKGVIGALSVTGPRIRMENILSSDELPNLLMGTANELSLNISYA